MKTVLAILLLACSHTALAQELRGTLRDHASERPIAGVVLLLLDSNGISLSRHLSNERGEYRVTLPPGAARLRLVRLGFQPREASISPVVDGPATLDLSMRPIPQLLEPVVAIANPLCARRRDANLAFALWQQARAGLLSTIVARESKPARTSVLVYSRILAGTRDSVVEQRVRVDSGQWSTPFFAAHSAQRFVRSGFVEPETDGQATWFGPDADVLLADEFQSAYCFSLADRDASRPNQLGLRFKPAKRRRGRVDIEGALWIDTSARALRDIEFRYVGVDRGVERFRPGGQVFFREMPNGVVFVDRWSVRMVTQVVDTGPRLTRGGAPGEWGEMTPSRYRHYLSVGGGEVARADWPDGTTWRARLGALRVHVVDRHGAPAAGVRLQLDSTDYAATSDSTGLLEITGLLPGPYKAVIIDSALSTIGVKLETQLAFVAKRDTVFSTTLIASTAAEAVASACDVDYTARTYLLVARAVTPDGKPIENVRWEVGSRTGKTGSDGLILPCSQFTRGETVAIRTWRERSSEIPNVITVALTARLTAVRIELPPSHR